MRITWTLLTAALLATGCTDGEDSGGFVLGFTLEGTAVDFWNGNTPLDGEAMDLCVSVADPNPVLQGGDLDILLTGNVESDGTFVIPEIVTSSATGVVVLVDDCSEADVVQGTGTGIPADTLSSLDYGDTLSGASAYTLVADTVDLFNAELAQVGYAGDLWTDGSMLGYVIDSSDLESAGPVGGATMVNDTPGLAFYYADADDSDGIFATGGAANTATDAAADALYITPGAPVDYYSADNGSDDFYNVLGGSLPGLSLFMRIPAVTQ